jgi:hypothetical protein
VTEKWWLLAADRRLRRAASQADRAGDRRQIIPFGPALVPFHAIDCSASASDRQPGDAQVMLRR